MLKKALVSAILAFAVLSVFGQGVDFARIEIEVNDPMSEYYYPKLFERYTLLDTTLNDEQYYRLYYGYATRDSYKPLLKNPYGDSLRQVLSTRREQSAEMLFQAIGYAEKILQTEPFNLREINVLAYAYNMLGNRDAAEKQAYRLKMITRIITSTGDGETQKSPWWIIYNSHADDILAMKQFTANKTVALSRDIIYIQAIGENRKRSNVFYFNNSLELTKSPEYLLDQSGKRIKEKKPWYK